MKIIDPRNAESIPLTDPEVTRSYMEPLSRWFAGSSEAWKEPKIGFAIEAWMIRSGRLKMPLIYHWLRLIETLWPDTDPHPWFRHMLWALTSLGSPVEDPLHGVRTQPVRVLNFDGAANSGKTETLAKGLLLLLLIDPAFVRGYIGAGVKQGANEGVFSRMQDAFSELVGMDIAVDVTEEDSKLDLAALMPLRMPMVRPSLGEIRILPHLKEAGYIKLFAYDKVANMKGRKPRKPGGRGCLFVGADEASYFEEGAAQQFQKALRNILRQVNAYFIAAQNPENAMDFGGDVATPYDIQKKRGGEFEYLKLEEDHYWHLNYFGAPGLNFRYDGHYSPNILAGEDKYVYLPQKKDIDELAKAPGGTESPGYLTEVRAWRKTAEVDASILTRSQARAGLFWEHDTLYSFKEPVRYAYSDTSLGGDKWTLLIAEVKDARNESGDSLGPVASPITEIMECPLLNDAGDEAARIDANWMERINALSGVYKAKGIRVGDILPVPLQGAVWTAEKLLEYEVLPENFAYDHSMRYSIMEAMNACVGSLCMSWDLQEAAPEEYRLPWEKDRTPKECYFNLNSFLHFLLASMIHRARWRSEDMLEVAIRQVCRRRKIPGGVKQRVESKDDYKKANANRSPDEGDTLIGLNGLIWFRGGFGDFSTEGGHHKDGDSIWNKLREMRSAPKRHKGLYAA